MPNKIRSKRQARFFHWVDANPSQAAKEGVDVGGVRKALTDSKHQKIGNLPERVSREVTGGRVTKSAW